MNRGVPASPPGRRLPGYVTLSADKIEAIRRGVDIVRVVSASVSLKKRGQRYLDLDEIAEDLRRIKEII